MTPLPSGQDVYQQQVQQQCRERLILDHLELVRHVVGRLVARLPAGCDAENLESAGILGLVEAAHHFQPERGAAFSTFAYPRIRGAILDELRRNCPVPQRVLRQISQVREVCRQLERPACPEDIARAAGMTEEAVDETLEAIRMARMHQSVRETDWLHAVCDRRDEGPSEAIEQKELLEALAQAISELPERERHVLILYHLEDLRLKEIGAVVKLSESRVSRLLSRAEARLQMILRNRLEGQVSC